MCIYINTRKGVPTTYTPALSFAGAASVPLVKFFVCLVDDALPLSGVVALIALLPPLPLPADLLSAEP